VLNSTWQILCDFDGTIVTDDVTDRLLESFAAPAWRSLEREWREGRIGSMACMRDQIALLDVAPALLDGEVARTEVDPGFPGFIALARRLDLPVTIVSDGLDRVIKDVLRRAKLADIEIRSSRLSYGGDGKWRLEFPEAAPDCQSGSGTCKCAIAKRGERRTLLIGDGRSDFCVAETADFVFAKDKLLAHCRERRMPHAAFADFAEAQQLLKQLVQCHPVRAALEPVVHG
jgi:2,3-diketo-5-methylthio-1-phosphopentane phosphatase